MVEDQTRARHRLSKFLLRHSSVWQGGSNWTVKHEAWLAAQRFDEPDLQTTFSHYRAVPISPDASPAAVEADPWPGVETEPFAGRVRRLAAYRGVTCPGGLALQAEVCDWRRFGQAASMMGFVALVPSEYSSGGSTHRGHSTKASNKHPRI
jgi:transposase